MRIARATAPTLAAVAVMAIGGCGNAGENAVGGLERGVARANDVSAQSSLQQGLVAAGLVRVESGGSFGTGPDDFAGRLQAKNPSLRFSTAGSDGPESVQVLGGGSGPATLVVHSSSGAFVAAWTDGGSTMYYRGEQPPAAGAGPSSGGGWSASPVS